MSETERTITATVKIVNPDRENRRHSLSEVKKDGTIQKTIAIDQDEMIIGRDADTQIRLSSNRASRHHAFLRQRGTDCILVDNDSHNGVILNGVKIHSAILREGDVIQVAHTIFVFHEG